jgi:hypothetical protein
MRPALKIAIVLCIVIVGGVAFWSNGMDERAGTLTERLGDRAAHVRERKTSVSASRKQEASVASVTTTSNLQDQFNSDEDLTPFVEKLHRQALKGDASSQYWLGLTLLKCGNLYDNVLHFGRSAKDVSEEEGASGRSESIPAHHQHLRIQCKRLNEAKNSKYGNAKDWIQTASEAGDPRAQSMQAAELMYQERLGNADSPGRPAARVLMLEALQSRDADVIAQMGGFVDDYLDQDGAQESRQALWSIAGCARGADCGPRMWWVRALCASDDQCQPNDSGIDLIRRKSGAKFPELEEEARKLNERIDAGEWDELGF